MKKLFFILAFSLFTLSLFSQNYGLIRSDKTYNFSTTGVQVLSSYVSSPVIQSIQIYSVVVEGTDSLFYNPQTLRHQEDYSYYECPIRLEASWIGKHVQTQAEGMFLFFNQQDDTIRIHSQAEVGESWQVYEFENGNYMEATLMTNEPSTILGLTDSLKTARLQVKDSDGSDVGHSFNNKTIQWSKNYGLVKFYDMHLFPNATTPFDLVGQSNPELGVQNLTAKEIFDYEIGDEIHVEYKDDNFGSNYFIHTLTKDVVLAKSYAADFSSVTYQYDRTELRYEWNNVTGMADTTFFSGMYEETIDFTSFYNQGFSGINFQPNSALQGSPPTVLYYDDNGRAIKRFYSQIQMYELTCWGPVIGLGETPSSWVIQGLGGEYYNRDEVLTGEEDHKELVYYHKGSEEWGNPINFDVLTTVPNSPQQTSQVQIAPNPFTDILTFDFPAPQEIDHIAFYTIFGKKVKTIALKQRKQLEIDGAIFPVSGIYFFTIMDKKGTVLQSGKVVKR